MHTETIPVEVECCICGTVLPAGAPHPYVRSEGDSPVAGPLCEMCAKPVVKLFGDSIETAREDSPLTLAENISFNAQNMLTRTRNPVLLRRSGRILRRYGWDRRMIRGWAKARRINQHNGVILFSLAGVREPSLTRCLFCDSPDVTAYLGVADDGMQALCSDCVVTVIRMAEDGWIDLLQTPDPHSVLTWLHRFDPDELDRLTRSVLLNNLQDGLRCVVTIAGMPFEGILHQSEDGVWMCDDRPIITEDGEPMGGVDSINILKTGDSGDE